MLLAHSDHIISGLTDRENEVVKWTACGKTASEIGLIRGISEPSILFHLKNAKNKLNVINKHQLTARALALGMPLIRHVVLWLHLTLHAASLVRSIVK